MYDLTPISLESVYKDFAKYHVYSPLQTVPWSSLEIGAHWLSLNKLSLLKNRPQLLSYDAVISMIDMKKSATAIWNQVFRSKRQLLDCPSFKISFVQFLHSYARGESVYILWLAIQKEEIRAFEKIIDKKLRSIIIGSIYSLILGHMLYGDLDDEISSLWFEFRSGIGMSFFNSQYHRKISEYLGKKCLGYSDVGKYDSRQAQYLQQLAANSADYVYSIKRVNFYDLLGSLQPIAVELGMVDFVVDVPYLRARLIEDGVFGPVIMPDGTVVTKNTGEDSGNHRTGHSNTDRYKIVEFAAAYDCGFKSYKEYRNSQYVTDHTGDDMIHGGPDYRIMDRMNEIWLSLNCDVETHKVDSVSKLEYLGTNPLLIRWYGLLRFVPRTNSSKIIAALMAKLTTREIDVDISRLSSAKILCHYTEDREVIDDVIKQYLVDHPQCRKDKRWWSDTDIHSFYVGHFESSTSFDLLLSNLL